MTHDSHSTLWVHLQTDGAWGGRYTDAHGTFNIATDCGSPEAVEATVTALGIQPEHVEVGRLSVAYECRMLEKADHDIAAAHERVREQERRVALLERNEHDTAPESTQQT